MIKYPPRPPSLRPLFLMVLITTFCSVNSISFARRARFHASKGSGMMKVGAVFSLPTAKNIIKGKNKKH